MKDINIVLRAPSEGLREDLSEAVKNLSKSNDQISKDVGKTISKIEKGLESMANAKSPSRVVKQLQNMAMEARALGPEFEDLANKMIQEAGSIKDSFGDIGTEIDYFASDTRKFDAVLEGVQSVAAGFEIAQGAMILFGDENEDLQKAMTNLMATMGIINGLQTIQNAIQKQSVMMIGLQTGALKVYNIVVGQSVGSMKAFRIALAATGVGLAIVGIAMLIEKFMSASDAADKAAEEQKKYSEQLAKTMGDIGKQESQLKAYLRIVQDTSKSEKVRAEALEQMNALGVETSDINLKSAGSLQKLTERIRDNIEALKQKALAEVYAGKVAEASAKYAAAQEEALKSEAEAQEKYNNLIKQGGDFTQALNILNERKRINSMLLLKAETALTSVINQQQSAIEAYTKAQSKVIKLNKESGKIKMNFAPVQRFAEIKGTDLKSVQKRQRKSDLSEWRTEMIAGKQIKLTEVIEDTSERQRSAFALTSAQYVTFQESLEQANINITSAFQTMAGDIATGLGVMFGEMIVGENGFQNFMNNLLFAISDFLMSLGKALIAAGVAMTAFYEFLTTNPALAIGAGIAAVAASVVVKNVAEKGVSAFADGGIVSGPTLGLVGEYAGASTNPEVIAPLDKLKKMIQPSAEYNGGFIAETRISGKDLALIVKRATEAASRG